MEKRYGVFSEAGSKSPPIGLAHLAPVAAARGWDAEIIDAPALGMTRPETVEAALARRPALVGITAATLTISDAAAVAAGIKKSSPQTVIALGGAHISALPEATMNSCPAIDVGALGEGEDTLADLLGAVERGGDFAAVRGIIRRTGSSVEITRPRPYIKDLDSLPMPAWNLLPKLSSHYRLSLQAYKREPSFPVISSRGCPFNCAFCDNRVFGRTFRAYSPQYILRMLEELRDRHGIRDIFFYDDTFMTDLKRVRRICEIFTAKKLGLVWGCLSRVDTLDEELLGQMRAAGCWQISFGIESGDAEVLKRLKKNIAPEKAAEAVRIARKAGLRCHGFFMIGSPGETRESLRKTALLSRNIPLNTIQVSHFTPFPGSALYDEISAGGTLEKDFDRMNMWTPVFIPEGLTEDELRGFATAMMLRFYFRPRIIFEFVMMGFSASGARKLALLAKLFARGAAGMLFSRGRNN